MRRMKRREISPMFSLETNMKLLATKIHPSGWKSLPAALCVLSMLFAAASTAGAASPLVAAEIERGESPAFAAIEGAIEKVWIEYGVKVKGETGIRIHAKFLVKNALNVGCSIQATVERADGNSMLLKSVSNVYKVDKKVLVLKTFTPPYDPATYPDTKLFIPYWALGLKESDPNKMRLTVVLVGEARDFARSAMDFGLALGKAR